MRLLALQPEDQSADRSIHMSMSTFPFKDAPKYEALSYAWGNHSQEDEIMINETPVQVKQNLQHALLSLRWKAKVRILWVDAICINQNDEEEKTQQVSQMRDIFAQAEVVIMWIGDEDWLTEFHFGMLERWANRGVRLLGDSQLVEHENEESLHYIEEIEDDEDDSYDEGEDPPEVPGLPSVIEAIEPFFTRPYFNRSWIVQEVVVSKRAELICGDFSIPFDRFVEACFAMGIHSPYKSLRGVIFDITNMGLWQRKFRQKQEYFPGLDLMYLLTSERDKQASDPRDKIFALLGIANTIGESPIAVDYSKSVEEIYIAVARSLMITSNPSEVLSAVQGWKSKLLMPSWVPDWSQRWYTRGALNVRWHDVGFSAAGLTKPVMVNCQDQSTICLRGLRLDVIRRSGGVRLCNRRTEDGSPFVNEDSLRTDIKILGLEDESHYHFTKERYQHAYLRTITRDLSAFSSRLEDSEHEADRPSFYAWEQAGRPGLGPPEEVWQEISGDIAKLIADTDFFISERGYLGLGPRNTHAGDLICIFLGGAVPFVLRPHEKGQYQLVGECYVHGVMDGEAINGVNEADFEGFVII